MKLVRLEKITKRYVGPHGEVEALSSLDLEVNKGEYLVIHGPSGSGKTTLLMIISAMLRPTRGTVFFEDKSLYSLPSGERERLRAERIGVAFQTFHLIPYLSVLENVILAGGGRGNSSSKSRAEGILTGLGLSGRIDHKPAQLSAGEKQRAALARALMNEPSLLLADEPTGNLDPRNAQEVLSCLSSYRERGGTVIVATHECGIDKLADRVVCLRDGRLDPSEKAE